MKAHPYADYFAECTPERIAEIAADIKEHGQREAITVYEDQILDGRSRFAACTIAGVEPRFKALPAGWDPLDYVESCNLKRRDLTSVDRVQAVRHVHGERLRIEAAERQSAGVAPAEDLSAPVHQGRVAAAVAEKADVSPRFVAQIERVEREDPELFKQVVANEVAPDRAERILRDRKAAFDRSEKFKRESKVKDLPAADIRSGDFKSVLADVRDVDLIFTDPPYPKEFLPLWSELSEWAATALKPGALLVTYSGQYHLPDVLLRLSEHLTYQWLGWLSTPGPNVSVHGKPLMSGGKPVLFFSNGKLQPPFSKRRIVDVGVSAHITRDQATGGETAWEQEQSAPAYWIEALTEKGELVVDPFLGSGTFGLVAKSLGRRFVGAEVDAAVAKAAAKRIG